MQGLRTSSDALPFEVGDIVFSVRNAEPPTIAESCGKLGDTISFSDFLSRKSNRPMVKIDKNGMGSTSIAGDWAELVLCICDRRRR